MISSHHHEDATNASVDLYWIPLGAGDGGRCVRGSGRFYEALIATAHHRVRSDLYHSALAVRLGDHSHAIEMAPAWAERTPDRGVVAEGPVGVSGADPTSRPWTRWPRSAGRVELEHGVQQSHVCQEQVEDAQT